MHNFDTSLDDMLLHSNTVCVIRYVDQETNHVIQANGEEEEEESPRAGPVCPPGPVLPPRFLPELERSEESTSRPVLPPRETGTTAQLPAYFQKCAEFSQNISGDQGVVSGTRPVIGRYRPPGTTAPSGRYYHP
jgi:hypothetical protein